VLGRYFALSRQAVMVEILAARNIGAQAQFLYLGYYFFYLLDGGIHRIIISQSPPLFLFYILLTLFKTGNPPLKGGFLYRPINF
jgi:hypothetical protein